MAECWFYHLQYSHVTGALPALLERCRAKGWRALVRGTDAAGLEALDLALWTYRAEAFLPHGSEAGAHAQNPARNPIWLTQAQGNPNNAQALFLIDGANEPSPEAFLRICHVFAGEQPAALAAARSNWQEAKLAGLAPVYWRETAPGRWQQDK